MNFDFSKINSMEENSTNSGLDEPDEVLSARVMKKLLRSRLGHDFHSER